MIAVTGASGHLGRLVVASLLEKVPGKEIVALARDPKKIADFAARGVVVRQADYEKPETLSAAFAGVQKVLLISGNELGKRLPQHTAVVNAAKHAGVELLAYTSILHADTARISLAPEHKATEEMIRASGIPYVFLRNSWYFENNTEHLAIALAHGFVGSAKDGRTGAAARKDYADAAAAVLVNPGHANKIYELAGKPLSMTELAAAVSQRAGKTVAYTDVPPAKHLDILLSAGVPKPMAEMLVDADAAILRGELEDESEDLARLIGRPLTPLATAVAAGLAQASVTA